MYADNKQGAYKLCDVDRAIILPFNLSSPSFGTNKKDCNKRKSALRKLQSVNRSINLRHNDFVSSSFDEFTNIQFII